MINIKQISPAETFAVRQPVLRPGKPIEACIFEGDNLPTTIHLGIHADDILAGVISIFESSHTHFPKKKQHQLRGMAVLEAYQKKGLGEQLVQAAENLILEKQSDLIWFNAREIAVGFYTRMGYEIKGNPFPITDIGLHYVMFKKLR